MTAATIGGATTVVNLPLRAKAKAHLPPATHHSPFCLTAQYCSAQAVSMALEFSVVINQDAGLPRTHR
jgi:hypothetical protein